MEGQDLDSSASPLGRQPGIGPEVGPAYRLDELAERPAAPAPFDETTERPRERNQSIEVTVGGVLEVVLRGLFELSVVRRAIPHLPERTVGGLLDGRSQEFAQLEHLAHPLTESHSLRWAQDVLGQGQVLGPRCTIHFQRVLGREPDQRRTQDVPQ